MRKPRADKETQVVLLGENPKPGFVLGFKFKKPDPVRALNPQEGFSYSERSGITSHVFPPPILATSVGKEKEN